MWRKVTYSCTFRVMRHLHCDHDNIKETILICYTCTSLRSDPQTCWIVQDQRLSHLTTNKNLFVCHLEDVCIMLQYWKVGPKRLMLIFKQVFLQFNFNRWPPLSLEEPFLIWTTRGLANSVLPSPPTPFFGESDGLHFYGRQRHDTKIKTKKK